MSYSTSTEVETGLRDCMRENLTDPLNRSENWIFAGRPNNISIRFPIVWLTKIGKESRHTISHSQDIQILKYQVDVFSTSRSHVNTIIDELDDIFKDNFSLTVLTETERILEEPNEDEGVLYHGVKILTVLYPHNR